MFDPSTLMSVVIMLGLILGLCMLGLRQTLPAAIGGLYPWSFALFAMTAAAVLALQVRQGRLGETWMLLAGLCYVAGAMALAIALRRLCQRSTPRGPILLLFLLAATPAWLSLLVQLPQGWSWPWLMLVMLLCTLVGLHSLWQAPAERDSLGGRLLLFSLSMMLLSNVLRLFLYVRGDLQIDWLAAQETVKAQFGLLFASGALLLGTLGMILVSTDRLRRMLEHLASHDALTGLFERNGFRAPAEHSLALAQRRAEPVACLLCDIDFFKLVNDRFGHPAGDAALVMIAARLRDAVRASDLVARYGGEEFALLLPNCDEAAAGRFAERLRAAIEAQPLPWNGKSIALTVSIGIAVGRAEQLQLEPLYRRADRALYAAKHGGRNTVRLAPPGAVKVASYSQNETDSSTASAN